MPNGEVPLLGIPGERHTGRSKERLQIPTDYGPIEVYAWNVRTTMEEGYNVFFPREPFNDDIAQPRNAFECKVIIQDYLNRLQSHGESHDQEDERSGAGREAGEGLG